MNGYDFDKTIYKKDSFLDLYFFCLFHYFYIIFLAPFQLIVILFVIGNRKYIKQVIALYLVFIPHKKKTIEKFWDKNEYKIASWYKQQKKDDDIIISASPRFLLEPICKRLKIKNLICTNMNIKNGKIIGENCRGEQKLIAYRKLFGENNRLKAYYGDSNSDAKMKPACEHFYLVNKDYITER